MSAQTIIKANILFDGQGRQENVFVIIENDRIVDVCKGDFIADFEGVVTPAFIDPHSHIGMFREGEPASETEGNDITQQIMPLSNPLNSIYFDDQAFRDAVDFGVLYSCVVPGSGNLLGGRAKIIRNFATNRSDAEFKDYGFKMALGFNPRSTTEWKGERPNTRMGVYALLEKKFDEVLRKKAQEQLKKEKKLHDLHKRQNDSDKSVNADDYNWEKQHIDQEFALAFSEEENALLELLNGEKVAKVHVHKDDDVLYLIQLVNKYGLKATADHTCDVFHQAIFDALAENNIPVVYGPLGSLAYKVELKHAFYTNAKLLMDSKAFYGLMTDHPVIHTITLRDSLKYFLIHGMTEAEAISIITSKNAKILGIEDQLGTVESGKLASLTVWNNNPLHLGAFPKAVFGEGKLLRQKS